MAAEASENEHRGFSSGLRKLTEVSHRRAAAVADSNHGLIRFAHVRIIVQRDRHGCTKTANQHWKCNGVFRQVNARRTGAMVLSFDARGDSLHCGSNPDRSGGLVCHGQLNDVLQAAIKFRVAFGSWPHSHLLGEMLSMQDAVQATHDKQSAGHTRHGEARCRAASTSPTTARRAARRRRGHRVRRRP